MYENMQKFIKIYNTSKYAENMQKFKICTKKLILACFIVF